jgi:hypothetical protein
MNKHDKGVTSHLSASLNPEMSRGASTRVKIRSDPHSHSFAIFVYFVPIVSEIRQMQIMVTSPEGGPQQ